MILRSILFLLVCLPAFWGLGVSTRCGWRMPVSCCAGDLDQLFVSKDANRGVRKTQWPRWPRWPTSTILREKSPATFGWELVGQVANQLSEVVKERMAKSE